MSKVVAIVQARMGSNRLPGKVLKQLGDQTVLDHVIGRVRMAHRVDEVVLATSTASGDDRIEDYCRGVGILCFRGSELDVLDRYRACAVKYGADVVLRITADCPFVDPAMLDAIIHRHLDLDADYVAFADLPTGVPGETLSRSALERSWHEAIAAGHREHVVTYVLDSPQKFRVHLLKAPDPLFRRPDIRITLDTPADYAWLCSVAAAIGPRPCSLNEIIQIVDRLHKTDSVH